MQIHVYQNVYILQMQICQYQVSSILFVTIEDNRQ